MRALKDLTGQKFGRLTVIERVENKGKQTCWKCQCECGNEVIVQGNNLKNGHTVSCGCFRREKTSESHKTHGMARSKIYKTWKGIKKRCFNPNFKYYKDYGGRGITMFPEWIDDPKSFIDYVSKLPHFGEENYSLDRINNDGNYEPNNLRFTDRKTQSRNTRRNIIVEYQGRKMTLMEAAELSGIPYDVLKRRYHHGDRGERLFRPVNQSK